MVWWALESPPPPVPSLTTCTTNYKFDYILMHLTYFLFEIYDKQSPSKRTFNFLFLCISGRNCYKFSIYRNPEYSPASTHRQATWRHTKDWHGKTHAAFSPSYYGMQVLVIFFLRKLCMRHKISLFLQLYEFFDQIIIEVFKTYLPNSRWLNPFSH